jgi:alkylation response protein AidB-like acyl-CoA dehydrogenase
MAASALPGQEEKFYSSEHITQWPDVTERAAMDLSLTDEQESVRDAFGDFFLKESTPARVRAAEPLGFDPRLWQSLAQTGAITMGAPERLGGGGASTLDLVLVAEEYGRRIAAVPLPEAIAAADALSRVPAGAGFLPGIADGSVVPTLAPRPSAGGLARLAPAGAVADLIVALDDGDLVAVSRSGNRPYATPPRNLASAPVGDWDLHGARQRHAVLASGDRARALYADACALWRLLTAAALNGLREEALRMGVAYVKERHAFGVPIGQFQAIQHRLADVATAGDGLRMLVYEAGWARDAHLPDAGALAGMALLAAADVAFRTCRESLQFHGGYGYTLEYDVQMYFRRAKAWPLAGGPIHDQYQQLAGQLFAVPLPIRPRW